MVDYSVTISINEATRKYLKGHSYSMYVFKGIKAGTGAISTVWQKISGTQLYDQDSNDIIWTDNFYIGETSVELQNGAKIKGVNPYKGADEGPAPVKLWKLYSYGGISWKKNPRTAPESKSFAIENKPSQLNNFYISQHKSGNYIVVQSLLGAGGLGTFEPVEKIAIILTSLSLDTGTLIKQTFSSGLIVILNGENPSVKVSYDTGSGWNGPKDQITRISAVDNIYDEILHASADE